MDVCYLCGKPVTDGQPSGDHAVPRVLLRGKQPKVRSFDYGGKLPTHATCNNRFRDERYVLRALDLIAALHDPGTVLYHVLPGNPPVRFAAINSGKLPDFTRADLRFFKINDARNDRTGAQHIRPALPGNPFRLALFVSLSVLAKSAAALLLARHHLGAVPEEWSIVAIPYAGDATKADFSDVFSDQRPFAPGIRVLMGEFTAASLALYVTDKAMVYFLIRDARGPSAIESAVIRLFQEDVDCLRFNGNSLIQLLDHRWQPATVLGRRRGCVRPPRDNTRSTDGAHDQESSHGAFRPSWEVD